MIKEDYLEYLNNSIETINFELTAKVILNFIYEKHKKTVSLQDISNTFTKHNMQGSLLYHIQQFRSSLVIHFEFTEIWKNNKLIKYAG